MVRVFIDSSVLFSACYSETGGSREIILKGVRGELELVISEYVKEEVEINLKEKASKALPFLHQFLDIVPFKIIKPTVEEVEKVSSYVDLGDAPIVAAAKHAKADYLVSLDREHLVGVISVKKSGIKIVLPGKLLEDLRQTKN